MGDVLNCVFVTDEGYLMPTITAVTSLVENLNNPSECQVHVIAVDLCDASLSRLSHLTQQYQNVLTHECTSESAFQSMANSSHVSTTALFKFLLPDLLSHLDSVLYLDGDILISQDIVRHFNTIDLDERYAAVVKDINVMKRQKRNPLEKFGANHEMYFNSGVMLLNLKKMRQDGLTQQLIDFKRNHKSMFMDQDAFNVCFQGQVLFLSPRFNFLTFGFSSFMRAELESFYGEKETFSASGKHNSVVIYHFASQWKPWKYWLTRYTAMFQHYYQKTSYRDQTLTLNYSVQVTFFILVALKMIAPYMLKRAFEPTSRKASLINALLKSIEEAVKALMPTFVHILVQHIRDRQRQ